MNTLALDGEITRSEEPRFTPSGLQVFEGNLRHEGIVREAGGNRRVVFETLVVAYGQTAERLQKLAPPVRVSIQGYIAPRSVRSQRLTVYITEFK